MDIQQPAFFKQISKHQLWGVVLFIALLLTTYLLYTPGLTGPFIFDDIQNLSPLGGYPNLDSWGNFWSFLLEGRSGPTGRPISLASFYLNDVHWPSTPNGFIYTNILIHLLNGALVFWFIYKLSAYFTAVNKKQIIITSLISALWLLHPMHITAVLYIIQRMTELSATFMLAGLIFYLYGREALVKHTLKGLALLFIGVGFSLLFAILSKENGILLVAYILVVEFFLLRPLNVATPKYFNAWLLPAVVAPFIAIMAYLAYRTNPNAFELRDFSLTERLLTEPRIIFDYIRQILLPNMNELTLYHDDYVISKSLFNPITTLPAILGVVSLLGVSLVFRKKTPVLAFAIAWFFAGHLVESTVLPLELYFEHRNYLPMLGIFAAVVYYATTFINHTFIKWGLFALMLTFNSFVLWQNTTLWGKPLELVISWQQSHPNSGRTKQEFNFMLKRAGLKPELFTNTTAPEVNNTSPMLKASIAMSNLASKCESGEASEETLKNTLNIMQGNIIHVSTASSMTSLMNSWFNDRCTKISLEQLKHFLTVLAKASNTQKSNVFNHEVNYGLSRVYFRKKNLDKTIFYLKQAYKAYPSLNNLLLQAVYLNSAGLYDEALAVLNDTSKLESSFRKKMALKIRNKELEKLRAIITRNINIMKARKNTKD